jgi:bifunctional non-homologous end joining protein LigD
MRRQQFPMFVVPMLLATGRELPTTDLWWAELKLDGARGQLRVADGVASLRTRTGRRCDGEFPEIIAAASGLPELTLDGEIVVLGDDGSPDFSALRTRLGAQGPGPRATAAARPAVFYAFDILRCHRRDLRGLPLRDRRRVLEEVPLDSSLTMVTTHPGEAAAVLTFAREHLLEGIVVKQSDSPYRSGRSRAWQKFKIRSPERVWVTAWRPGGPGELDRYWVSRYVNDQFVPAGEVTYGLTPSQASAIRPILNAAVRDARGRHRLRRVMPVVEMTVAAHGRKSGWLRDPVITKVSFAKGPSTSSANMAPTER